MRRTAALTAALLAAACSTTGAPRPGGGASAAAVAALLNTASQDMYANRYDAAQREYMKAVRVSPRDADAAAAYALFLNYAGEQATAQSEAQTATSLDPHDGYALAVRCRVDDWSEHFAAAVSSGRDAVGLSPSQPLTHLFLAEALADTGQLTESQAEIAAAKRLVGAHPGAYLRAEVLREEGNLAGDRGDDRGRLASFQAASAQQPGWLYRTTEVVDAMLGAGSTAAADRLLASAAGRAPDDSLVLQALGGEAIGVDDASLAVDLWRRAADLAPADPSVLDGAGEVEVAASSDNSAAIGDFEAALRVDPSDVDAAGYLLALARYLQHSPGAAASEIDTAVTQHPVRRGARPPAPPDPDARQAADAMRALSDVNHARAQAGLPPVHLDPHLSASAESHSYYWLFNNLSTTVAGLGIHEETPGLPGYSGQTPGARALAWGYPDGDVAEDIDHRGDAVEAVDEWVNSVYHRFPVLRPDLVAIGYGEAYAGPVLMEDLELGFGNVATSAPVVYPGAGQTGVPAFFVDNELPDPVPSGQPRTTGSPVSVTFAEASPVQVSSFTLQDADGHILDAYTGAPTGESENSAWLLPKTPLGADRTYTARIVATISGQGYVRTWSFTTAP